MHRRFDVALIAFMTVVFLMGSTTANSRGDGAGRDFVQPQLQRIMPLVINEFMASNRSFIKDPQGQFDD